MRLLSWLDGGVWSGAHIAHFGDPLCAAPMPKRPQGKRWRPAEIRDWPHICKDCKTLAIKAATRGEPLDVHELIFTER